MGLDALIRCRPDVRLARKRTGPARANLPSSTGRLTSLDCRRVMTAHPSAMPPGRQPSPTGPTGLVGRRDLHPVYRRDAIALGNRVSGHASGRLRPVRTGRGTGSPVTRAASAAGEGLFPGVRGNLLRSAGRPASRPAWSETPACADTICAGTGSCRTAVSTTWIVKLP
jgi:hypothetical protein